MACVMGCTMGCPQNLSCPASMGAYRRLRGRFLGDDSIAYDTSGDSGGDFTDSSGDGGGIADIYNQLNDGTYVPSSTDTFSPVSNAPQDYIPFSDTGPGGVPGVSTGDGGFIDVYGTTYLPDGSQITAYGTQVDASGNVTLSDGSQALADGTYVDSAGNVYPPGTPQAEQAQQRAAASSGGGSSGGGGKGGGSGSQQQQNPCQNPIYAMLMPKQCGGQQAQNQQQQKQNQSGSFGSFMNQYGGWLIAGTVAFILVPPIITSAVGGK